VVNLLGTDATGRDILSRLIYGARLSLLGPALIIAFARTAGVTLAISALWIGVVRVAARTPGISSAAVVRVRTDNLSRPGQSHE